MTGSVLTVDLSVLAAPVAAQQQPNWKAILAVVVVAYLVCYYVSLHLHPWTKCSTCRGTGKHRGAMFAHGFRPCAACKGSSRQPRLGARMLGLPRKG
jgi:hypothetical protein